VPGAVAGAVIIGVLVFGVGIRAIDTIANLNRNTEITQVSTTRDGETTDPTGTPTDGGAKGQGKGDTTKEPAKPKPTTKPATSGGATVATPAPKLALEHGDVAISWSVCKVDDFVYYRVVRSTDEAVSWPMGPGDVLVATIKAADRTRFVDTRASAGRRYHYRVVGIAKHDSSYRVACRSGIQSVLTPSSGKPEPNPAPSGPLGLSLSIKEKHPYVNWTACARAGADYYKVVRSPDATVRWPVGGNDTLVAAVGMHDTTAFWDSSAPHGDKVWYRVFCVAASDSGYSVLRASAARPVVVPVEAEAPMPSEMDGDADVVDGEVVLDWEECGADGFSYYKVVRSPGRSLWWYRWAMATWPIRP
jgi:hypothetical protein